MRQGLRQQPGKEVKRLRLHRRPNAVGAARSGGLYAPEPLAAGFAQVNVKH